QPGGCGGAAAEIQCRQPCSAVTDMTPAGPAPYSPEYRERMENAGTVWADLDAGADLAPPGGLLLHVDVEAVPGQGKRGRESTKAAADDGDRTWCCHRAPRSVRFCA